MYDIMHDTMGDFLQKFVSDKKDIQKKIQPTENEI